ncbi:BppU family phage baseplate upper protein [Bacillus sp. mrc49]|uniref:BppU family phage baseplate upper protein n=1 Tax=Bacillus sp. mrc49 TaxID=2054913 RepID=UPI000C26E35F|nr:BppU family phage baseplate upper protein [Bacillus sp. mrc49]PJN90995.1 hypothetical protein CVN76_07340 [Bacillus sp. mrc49]
MTENEIFKSGKMSVDVAPRTVGILKTSIQFSTQDQGTAKLIFSLSKDGLPLPLSSAATAKIFLRMADGSVFEKTASIVDQIHGKLEYVLEEEISHPGLAKGELNVNYANGQALSVCKFSFNIDASLMDQDIVPLAEYYVKNFNTLQTDIEERAAVINDTVDELQEKVDGFETTAITLDPRLTTVEGKVNTVTTQLAKTVKKINGVAPDENGNVVLDSGAGDMTTGSYSGEPVELTSPPSLFDVQSINAVDIQKTSITIEWPMSLSDSFDSYKIYKDNVLIATLPYTQRSFTITDLTPYKDYTIKVAVADEAGKVTTGTTKVIKSKGYFLEMNGFPDVYLMLPSLTVTEFVMECKINKPETAVKKFIFDGRLPLSLGEISTANNVENYGSYFPKVFVNDIQVGNNTKWFDTGVPITFKWQKPTGASTGTMKVFSNYLGKEQAAGEIYSIKAYNGAALLAHYDFRTGTYNDLSGNNNQLAYTSGRFR